MGPLTLFGLVAGALPSLQAGGGVWTRSPLVFEASAADPGFTVDVRPGPHFGLDVGVSLGEQVRLLIAADVAHNTVDPYSVLCFDCSEPRAAWSLIAGPSIRIEQAWGHVFFELAGGPRLWLEIVTWSPDGWSRKSAEPTRRVFLALATTAGVGYRFFHRLSIAIEATLLTGPLLPIDGIQLSGGPQLSVRWD